MTIYIITRKKKKRYITLCHLHKIIKMIYKVFVCFNFSKPFKCGMLAHTYEYIYIYIYIYIGIYVLLYYINNIHIYTHKCIYIM